MKVVLLGRTGSGKSTIAASLGEVLGLAVLEVDDETTLLNGGRWPEDEDVIDYFFAVTNRKVLAMESVLYVTSWLSRDEIRAFYQQGFKIVELHAKFDELLKRKQRRGDAINYEQFRINYEGYLAIVNRADVKSMIALSINTSDLAPEETIRTIVKTLNAG